MGRRSIRDEVKSAEFAQIKSVLEKERPNGGNGGGQQGCVSGEGVCECRGFNEERVRIPRFLQRTSAASGARPRNLRLVPACFRALTRAQGQSTGGERKGEDPGREKAISQLHVWMYVCTAD
jgi:hypothetical protein